MVCTHTSPMMPAASSAPCASPGTKVGIDIDPFEDLNVHGDCSNAREGEPAKAIRAHVSCINTWGHWPLRCCSEHIKRWTLSNASTLHERSLRPRYTVRIMNDSGFLFALKKKAGWTQCTQAVHIGTVYHKTTQ